MKNISASIFSQKFSFIVQILTFVSSLAFLSPLKAQIGAPDFPPGLQQFKTESKLFTVIVVPNDKNAKIFFAGHAAAKIDFEKDHKLLEVYAFKKGQKEQLSFDKNGDTYIISNMPSWKEPFELQLKSETRGQVEETKVKIKLKKN